MKASSNKQQGFMLIEILVAVFIFTIVMLVSLTAVLALVDANRKNQSIKSVVNNLNLVITGITKNMAVSTNYYCGAALGGYPQDYVGSLASCTSVPKDAITFTFNEDKNNNGTLDVVRYKYQETDSVAHTGQIFRSIDDVNPGSYVPVTAPEVKITGMSFYVFDTDPLVIPISGGTPTGDRKQPRVIMTISGYAGTKESTRTQFNIQTTVSQRTLDAKYQP